MTIRAFVRTAMLLRRYKITQNLLNEYKEISQYKNEQKEKLLDQILPHLKKSLLSLLYEIFTDLSSLREIPEVEQKEAIVDVRNFVGAQIRVFSEKNCDMKKELTTELLNKIETETKIAINIIQKNKDVIKKKHHSKLKKLAYAGVLAARAATMGAAPVSEGEVMQSMKQKNAQVLPADYDEVNRINAAVREQRKEMLSKLGQKTLGELRTQRVMNLKKLGFSDHDTQELWSQIKDDVNEPIYSVDYKIEQFFYGKYGDINWVGQSSRRVEINKEMHRLSKEYNLHLFDIMGCLSYGIDPHFFSEFVATKWYQQKPMYQFYELFWTEEDSQNEGIIASKMYQTPLYLIQDNWNYFKQFANIKDKNGDSIVFSMNDVMGMWRAGTDVGYLKNIASKATLKGYELRIFSNLSVSALTYVETDKPNALIIFPEDDYNGAFLSQGTKSFVDIYGIKHDCKVIVTGNEQEIFDAIKKFKPRFISLGGHGFEGMSIHLSSKGGEEGKIGIEDYKHFRKLKKKGYFDNLEHIFFMSCSAAKFDRTGIAGTLKAAGINNISGSKTDFEVDDMFLGGIQISNATASEIQALGERVLHANTVEFIIKNKENTRTIRK